MLVSDGGMVLAEVKKLHGAEASEVKNSYATSIERIQTLIIH